MVQLNYSAERALVRLAGLVCGGVAVVGAFRNGQSIGATWFDGLMFGSAGLAVVVMSWFLPNLAAEAWANRARVKAVAATVLWLVTAAFTLIQAVGYSAQHRTATVESRQSAKTATLDARTALAGHRESLGVAKANPRWGSSHGCTNATVPASVAFCEHVAELQRNIANLEAGAGNNAAVGSTDAQAETLAWVSGIDSRWIANAMPVLMAIVFELCAGLGFFTASPAMAGMPRNPGTSTVDHAAHSMPSIEVKAPRPRGANGRFLPKPTEKPVAVVALKRVKQVAS